MVTLWGCGARQYCGRSGKKAISALGGGSGGFAKVRAHYKKEVSEFEGFAEEEAGMEAHTVELPIVATSDNDDGSMASVVVAAQDFVEGGAVEIGQADIEEDEVRMKRRYGVTGKLTVVEEGKLPVDIFFEGVAKKPGETRVIFDDGDAPGGGDVVLQ